MLSYAHNQRKDCMGNLPFRIAFAVFFAVAGLALADGPQFRSNPLLAGRVSLTADGFTFQRTFGTIDSNWNLESAQIWTKWQELLSESNTDKVRASGLYANLGTISAFDNTWELLEETPELYRWRKKGQQE